MDDLDDPSSSSQDLETMRLLFGSRVGNGTASVTVNAGGMGLWAAVTACLMTLAACVPSMVILSVMVVDQGRKIDRLQDHVNVIYRATPALKPKEEPKK